MPSLLPDNNLKILLLGGFNAQLNSNPMKGFSYNKMRALLAYLAVEQGKDHSREFLSELLWGDCGTTTARDNLRRTLSNLRRVLELPTGRIIFSVTNHTIRFTPNVYVDTIEFAGQIPTPQDNSGATIHHEERLITLYKGEFLRGLSLPDCPDFEDWIQMQRETLHFRALALLEKLSNHYAEMSDYSKALQFTLRYTELEPWDDDAHHRAMHLYVLNGQHSAAINQYEICCSLLKNDLGILPNEKTRQLAEQIRNGKFRRRLTDTTVETLPPLQVTSPSSRERRIRERRNGEQYRVSLSERRQVTALYCELTLAGGGNYPDEALELLSTLWSRVMEIIRQSSGHIVQTHSGLLVYFGYPEAHEDAARHAVQAALAVIGETAQHGIESRASVHTGHITTDGESFMLDTIGKTSKFTIQLCYSVASNNEVAISQKTHDIVAGYFDCVSLGAQSLPGYAQPLEIFRVVQENGARTRLDAAAQLTSLVGRKVEITKLMGLWEESRQGSGHVVLVQGEAGMGKSRLLHMLKERLADQSYTIRELRCFPEFSRSPFHPIIALLEAVFGFTDGDTPKVKFGKLVGWVEAIAETHHNQSPMRWVSRCSTHPTRYPESEQQAVPLLANLLSLPLSGHYQQPGFTPQNQKEQTLTILLDLLQALAAHQPVLLIVEDLHWIDPSSLELLTLFVEQKRIRPIFAVFTARTEFTPPWKDSLCSTLALAPLAGDEVVQMISSLSEDVSAATIRRIVERADGVPLFVEEMAKIANLDNQANIPATLHDLLAARIDSMGEAKYTAQLAATIGREFDLDLLYKVSQFDPAVLAHSLNALQDAGFIFKLNDSVCQFKHALIQEAAYQSQTKPDRKVVHSRVAQTLQNDFPQVVVTKPELIAHHLDLGGEIQLSIEYWITGGQRAAQCSANAEAIEHFNRGLQCIMSLPPDNGRDRLEFELRINLGTALIATSGYGSIEAGQAYTRALELRDCVDDDSGLFRALWGMWLTSSSRVGHLHSLELAEILLGLAEQHNDVLQLQLAHYAMGNSSFMTGNPNAARIHFDQSMALYLPSHHEAMVKQFGENFCVSSGSLLSCVLWLQGFSQQAVEVSQRTLALARQVNHPYSLGYALCAAAILNRWMRQLETTGLLAQEAVALSHKYGFTFWQELGSVSYGWVLALQGKTEGIALMQQCLDAGKTIMSGAMILFITPLCEALVHQGQVDDALVWVDKALGVVNEKDGRFFESELYRLKGECLLEISATNMEEAEACFSKALAISHMQWAKSLELRATISMARLWLQQGKQEDARQLLEETYSECNEGADTLDLQEAAGLLIQNPCLAF